MFASKKIGSVVLIALIALSLIPTLMVDIPALGDYPNHLARMYVLADHGTTNQNPYYDIVFGFYPNLAMDLIVPRLSHFVETERATRLFFFSAQLLVVAGAITLEYVVKGRHEFAAFGALLALHSMPFSLGLVNFEFGMGIALFGMAVWIACEKSSWQTRFGIHVLFVVGLFFAHLFALGVYGLVLGLYELRRISAVGFQLARAPAIVLMLSSPVLALVAIWFVYRGATGAADIQWLTSWKLVWIALFLNGYDVYLAAASMTALILVLCYMLLQRSLELSPVGKWICVGLLIAYMVMPFKMFESRMADIRVITAAFLVMPAFFCLRRPNTGNQSVFAAGAIVCTLIAVNAGYSAYVWLSYRSDYEEMKTSFSLLRPSSFVLVANSGEVGPTLLREVPMHRMPTLAVHYAKAFVSSLYTVTGAHPVEVRSDLKHLDVVTATEDYHPPPLSMLRAIASGKDMPGAPRYLRNWMRDFHYVYLVGPHTDNALPGVLEELARSRRFTLYAVRRP